MDGADRVALALRLGGEAEGRHADVDAALAHLRSVLDRTGADDPLAVAAADAVVAAVEDHEPSGSGPSVPTGPEPVPDLDPDEAPAPPSRPHRLPVDGGHDRRMSTGIDQGEQLD